MKKQAPKKQKTKQKAKQMKIGKVQKIIIAAVAALLCIATVVGIILWSSLHPIEKFALKIARKQSFQVDIALSGVPLFGTVTFACEVDGNIQHIPDGSFVPEVYLETVDNKQYTYSKDENGKWVKAEGGESMFGNIKDNEMLRELINPDNYEPVEGQKNTYRQKADVVFDGCRNVVLKIEKNSCIIEMTTLSGSMAFDTVMVISNIGKVNITLPDVE